MSIDLKPCPFCGYKEPMMVDAGFNHAAVRCLNDRCRGQGLRSKDENVAAAAWNSRHEAAKADIGKAISPDQPDDCRKAFNEYCERECYAKGQSGDYAEEWPSFYKMWKAAWQPMRESRALAQLRSLFGLTLSLIQKQGYANTTEWNGELFIEDIFPVLAIESFAELKRYAVGGDLHLPLPEHPDQWRRESIEQLKRIGPTHELLFSNCPKCGERLIRSNRGIECGGLNCDYTASELETPILKEKKDESR